MKHTKNAPPLRPASDLHAPMRLTVIATVTALTVGACGGGSDYVEPQLREPTAFVAQAAPLEVTMKQDKFRHDTASTTIDRGDEWARHKANTYNIAGDNQNVIRHRICFDETPAPPLSNATIKKPVQLFDNLYFMGFVKWGHFAYKTKTGISFFDSLNSADEVNTITADPKNGLPAFGDPAIAMSNMKEIVITHGHTDHDGGVNQLRTLSGNTNAKISISAADFTSSKPYASGNVFQYDTTNLLPVDNTVDGVKVTGLSTPGHTPGTYSYILDVTDKGVPHKVAYLGGSAFPSGAAATSGGVRDYMKSVERFYDLILKTGADASMNSHPFFDGSELRMDAITAAGGYAKVAANPMVQDNDTILRSFAALRECAAAQLSLVEPTSAPTPVWKTTRTELYDAVRVNKGADAFIRAGVRVSNQYRVIAGGTVTISIDGDSNTYTGITNSAGVAVIDIPTKASKGQSISAKFEKMASSDEVNLPSKSKSFAVSD